MKGKTPPKQEWFCPTCRKLVTDIRSEFGQMVSPGIAVAPMGEFPVFVCKRCETPVMEMRKRMGKQKLITEKGIIEIG
jgi:hypothetical protein